jgi:hypothetical protein
MNIIFTAESREQEGGASPWSWTWSWLRPLDELVMVCEKFHNINMVGVGSEKENENWMSVRPINQNKISYTRKNSGLHNEA